MSENERAEPGAPLTRRELRELERQRVLEASAALAELASGPAAPSPSAAEVPSPAGPARTPGRETWQPPAAPTSAGPALTRRELRRRNVEVEPVRLAVPSQSPAPALEDPTAAVEASGPAPISGVASIPVSTIRESAHDQDRLPTSALAAAVQGRRAGMRDAVAARQRPAEGVAAGGLAVAARPAVELEAATGGVAERDAGEPPVATDGYGMPAVFMDAPVLPALRPIEEIEAELARKALGGSPIGDGPGSLESPEPEPEPGGPVQSAAEPAGPAEPPARPGDPSAGSMEPGGPAESGATWEPGAWEPVTWEPAAELEPDDPEPADLAPADPALADVTPAESATPAGTTFEPARTATVPSPRTVTSQRLGLEHAAAQAAPVSTRRRTRVAAPGPQPMPDDVLKVPAGRWQAVYGAWIGVAAIAVWALGPVALVLGIWSLVQARAEGYGRGRPFTAIVGGALGTIFGVLFLIFAPG